MGSYSKDSRKIQTLNTVQQLRNVRFGHQFPRHGLKLLHWLANDLVKFENTSKMLALHNPDNGDFGFHPFHNSEGILPPPPSQSRYFEAGNLHTPRASSLPFEQEQSWNSESNTDRIILSVDSKMMIGGVYITEHTPHNSQFSAKDTYHLRYDLLRSIKGQCLENFLRQAGYIPGETVPEKKDPEMSASNTIQEDLPHVSEPCCIIL